MHVRVVLYITVSTATSYFNNPRSFLLVTLILVGGLFFLNGITGFRAYKNLIVNILETGLYFNLLAFTAFSLYDFKTDHDIEKQTAVVYTSTIITFILLKGGRSGMAGMAFAIPLFWFVCKAIPLYRHAFEPHPTPRLTFLFGAP